MKKLIRFMIPALITALLFSVSLSAQKTTVTVKVEKDGTVIVSGDDDGEWTVIEKDRIDLDKKKKHKKQKKQ